MTSEKPYVLKRWYEYMEGHNFDILDELLAEEVVFHSPVVHTPQRGKKITKIYLMAAEKVLGGADFKYTKEIIGNQQLMLEFTNVIEGVTINGVDIVTYNANNQITEFKVMVRPLQGMQKLHQKMMEMLENFKQ